MWDAGIEDEYDRLTQQARQEAMDTGGDRTNDSAEDRAIKAADDVWNRLEEKKGRYAERLKTEILKAGHELGYRVPVTVRINPRDANLPEYGTAEHALLDIARDRTALPTVD